MGFADVVVLDFVAVLVPRFADARKNGLGCVWVSVGLEVETWETSQSINFIFRARKSSVLGILFEYWIMRSASEYGWPIRVSSS